MSPQKLNLGFATYGRTQTVGGDYTREPGVLGINLRFNLYFFYLYIELFRD
jgi:hypothetical protein